MPGPLVVSRKAHLWSYFNLLQKYVAQRNKFLCHIIIGKESGLTSSSALLWNGCTRPFSQGKSFESNRQREKSREMRFSSTKMLLTLNSLWNGQQYYSATIAKPYII
ncbi:hypothetical protein TNCT_735451 [Trichonephila clavata]|uniref:Uncharacterized protein n=1 Tax=Trichonephila clavata TaxID=2740835 RepID=A0A8X6HGP9_TRICU|nr:hypothetical protein TNCT_735451 [Trichonephila clavata]